MREKILTFIALKRIIAVLAAEAYAETLDTDEPLDKAYDHTFGEF